MSRAWTEHREASRVWWTLEGSAWRVVRRDRAGRDTFECHYMGALHQTKFSLLNAQRHCERDGLPYLMPWGWTTTPEGDAA